MHVPWRFRAGIPLNGSTLLPLSAFLLRGTCQECRPGSFLQSSLVTHSNSSYCCEQRRQGFCPATENLLSSAQRGNRGGTFFGPKQWLLQPVLSRPEGGWGFASYTRSAQAELLPLQWEIQNAVAQEHFFPGPRGGLVCHCRLEGCLLPHSRGLETQEVPQVRLRGKGLPIQGSSLWAISGPEDVHQVY